MNKNLRIAGALALLVAPAAAQSSAAPNVQRRGLAPAPTAQRTPLSVRDRQEAPRAGDIRRPRSAQDPAPAARPMIGVRIAPVDDAVSAQLPEHLMPALILTSIFEDSPAARAGLQVNDVVTAIDGNADVTVASLIETISSKAPGSVVSLEVSRAGQSQVFNVVVEELTPEPVTRRVPDMGFWEDYQGKLAWPHFGMRHDGKIMMQREEGAEWVETDVNSQLHGAWNQKLDSQGNVFLDLSRPDVDPQGNLRRQLGLLHEAYRDVQQAPRAGAQEQHLEQRIERLEHKVDDIHRMLSELLERTK